ncbi:MAG: ABC transporter permease, partial [Cyclobacteriaceae bacterium]|nr:ABC transporter permease [Cyclobacteriaceae bacterium]
MLRYFLASSVKSIRKYIDLSILNALGLAIAVSTCFYVFLYVNYETSFDHFNKNIDSIYRLVTDVEKPTGIDYESSSAPMGPVFYENLPQIEAFTRIFPDYLLVGNENSGTIEEVKVAYADSSLFDVFTFPLLYGNENEALKKPFSIVISESEAIRQFGTAQCLGNILVIDGEYTSVITGVMHDIPENSHFRTDLFVSMTTLLKEWNPGMNKNWKRFGFYTYFLINPLQSDGLEGSINGLAASHLIKENTKYKLSLEPLKELYLEAKPRGSRYGTSVVGNKSNIYILSLTAVLILFTACFNFFNLFTAITLNRTKEAGIKSVLGASKAQLALQFLSDALVLTLMSFIFSVIIVSVFYPYFDQIVGKRIITVFFQNFNYYIFYILLFLATILCGIISAFYPSIILSRINSMKGINGNYKFGTIGLRLKKLLIIAQFSISILLIVMTLIMYDQLNYIRLYDTGFEKENKLVVDFHFDNFISEHAEALKEKFKMEAGVENASISSAIPGRSNRKFTTKIVNQDYTSTEFISDVYFIDYQFLNQFDIQVIEGRGFDEQIINDFKNSMILNEAAVKKLGYHKAVDVIGKEFIQGQSKGIIIGVVKDFHFQSLHEEVQPLTIRVSPGWYTFMTFDLKEGNFNSQIKKLESTWNANISGKPFLYFLVDEELNNQYRAEERF